MATARTTDTAPQSDPRSSRAADDRIYDLREDGFDDSPDADSILYIRPDLIPNDIELRWVRESTLGEKDRGNMQQVMQRERFSPVLTSDFPTLAPPMLPGETEVDQYVRNGGLILMQRPKQLAERARRRLEETNRDVLQTVKRELNKGMDGQNFRTDASSNVEVVETTPDGRQRIVRTAFKE